MNYEQRMLNVEQRAINVLTKPALAMEAASFCGAASKR